MVGLGDVHIAGRVVGTTVGNAAKNSSTSAHAPVPHNGHEGTVRLGLLDQCLGGRTADGEVVGLRLPGPKLNGGFTRELLSVVCFRNAPLVAARPYDEGTVAAKRRHDVKPPGAVARRAADFAARLAVSLPLTPITITSLFALP